MILGVELSDGNWNNKNRHGIMSEEYDEPSLGLDEYRMGWTP